MTDIGLRGLLGAAAALAGVVALLLLVQRGGRAWGARRVTSGRVLVLEETLALDPRRRLHLIRCGGRRALLLTGGGADAVVGWLPAPAPDDGA